MNPAHLWIASAVLSAGLGTYLQALGSRSSQASSEDPDKRRRFATILGTLLTSLAVYCLWTGQQQLSQQASAKPVVELFIDSDKTLHVKNLGSVDLTDLRVFGTTYVLTEKELPEGGGHVAVTGIESFSVVSKPIKTVETLPSRTGAMTLSLRDPQFSTFFPVLDGIPQPLTHESRTVYCFRVLWRNGVTKELMVKYVLASPFKGFPSMFEEPGKGSAIGGGYAASRQILEIRSKIRDHQTSMFDDLTIQQYHE